MLGILLAVKYRRIRGVLTKKIYGCMLIGLSIPIVAVLLHVVPAVLSSKGRLPLPEFIFVCPQSRPILE